MNELAPGTLVALGNPWLKLNPRSSVVLWTRPSFEYKGALIVDYVKVKEIGVVLALVKKGRDYDAFVIIAGRVGWLWNVKETLRQL